MLGWLLLALLGPTPRPAAGQQGGYVVDAVWRTPDRTPIAVAGGADGGSLTAYAPLGAARDFAALVARDADGRERWRRVARDETGRELRPLAVAAAPDGGWWLTTAARLVRLAADGSARWSALAGDGHPDFGPAARGLAVGEGHVFSVDLANARVVGYRADDGALRRRWGTAGRAPGSFRAPRDVAVGADGTVYVADFGNQRVQTLAPSGSPRTTWPLPARPRALAVDGARLLVLLDDEALLTLDRATGAVLGRFGGPGRAPGRLRLASDVALLADGRVLVADRANRRVQVLRPAEGARGTPSGTATVEATPIPTADVSPTVAATGTPTARGAVRACPGQPATWSLEVNVPPRPPRLDVVLVFDTTGSMESLISVAQREARVIAERLRAAADDVAMGVLDVRDYPYGDAGEPTDWPWLVRGSLSTDPAALEAATAELWAGGGGDAPEAYGGALAALLEGAAIGWRPSARRAVVVLGDSVPRDDDLNAGVVDPVVPGVWTPGRPGWWRDSGPDWAPGSPDDVDWQRLLDRLAAEDVALLAGLSGAAPEALGGVTGDLVAYWSAWSAMAAPGGGAVGLSDVGRLPDALDELVAGVGRRMGRLSVHADPARWVTSSPAAYTDLVVPEGGLSRTFALEVLPEAGTPYGRYPVRVEVRGDGARYAALELTLDWAPTCDVTPTAAAVTATHEPTPTRGALVPSATPSAGPTASATADRRATATPVTWHRSYLPWGVSGP